MKKTPPCSNHLPPGYLRHGIQDHRVDHELPGKPERPNSFQVLRIPQASQGHPGGPLHPRRRCVPRLGQSPRPLPWDEPIGEPRCLQLLPVPVQDGHRTDVRYSGLFSELVVYYSRCIVNRPARMGCMYVDWIVPVSLVSCPSGSSATVLKYADVHDTW